MNGIENTSDPSNITTTINGLKYETFIVCELPLYVNIVFINK